MWIKCLFHHIFQLFAENQLIGSAASHHIYAFLMWCSVFSRERTSNFPAETYYWSYVNRWLQFLYSKKKQRKECFWNSVNYVIQQERVNSSFLLTLNILNLWADWIMSVTTSVTAFDRCAPNQYVIKIYVTHQHIPPSIVKKVLFFTQYRNLLDGGDACAVAPKCS